MLKKWKTWKHRRRALVAVLVVVAAFLLARHFAGPGPPPPGELPTYPAGEAGAHVGEHARVCGTVVDAAYVARARGRPTFLNFEEPYPDPVFTAVIWGGDRGRFEAAPERAYRGRRVCVRGRIRLHEGRPQIIVRRPGQIEPAEEWRVPQER